VAGRLNVGARDIDMRSLYESSNPNPPLRSARCRCARCSNSFNSVSAFDRHRYGDFGSWGRNRRCRTWEELRTKGWAVNAAGFWIDRARRDVTPRDRDCAQPGTYLAGQGAAWAAIEGWR
jgi:hypothetical protein